MVVSPGQVYRHCKGTEYSVITVAKHTETMEKMVVYQKWNGHAPIGTAWVRPFEMFAGDMDSGPLKGQRRFTFVGWR